MAAEEILDIINEHDEVIGQGTRAQIHADGSLHRIADIWFYNKNGQVLYQKRSFKKDNSPGLLGFSVGGHVEAGSTLIHTVIREIKEEAGLDVTAGDITFLAKVHCLSTKENQLKNIFAYHFTGKPEDLISDPNEVEYFEWWNIEDILNLSPEQKTKFAANMFEEGVLDTLKKVLELSKQV